MPNDESGAVRTGTTLAQNHHQAMNDVANAIDCRMRTGTLIHDSEWGAAGTDDGGSYGFTGWNGLTNACLTNCGAFGRRDRAQHFATTHPVAPDGAGRSGQQTGRSIDERRWSHRCIMHVHVPVRGVHVPVHGTLVPEQCRVRGRSRRLGTIALHWGVLALTE